MTSLSLSLSLSLSVSLSHSHKVSLGEKECINNMARTTLRKFQNRFESQNLDQNYRLTVKIGQGAR